MRRNRWPQPRIPIHWAQFLIVLVLTTAAFSRQANSEYPWWYDVASAPLKFDIPHRDHRYEEMQMLSIRSVGGVVRAYSLGCVRAEDGATVATKTVRTWQLNQRPEDQFFPIRILEITANPCAKESERLAVVRVQYADGGVWQISEIHEAAKR